MKDRIKNYMDLLFEEAPKTRKALELKEEMLTNAFEKYEDLLADGFEPEDAYKVVVESIGDVRELFGELKEKNYVRPSKEDIKKRAVLTTVSVGLYIFSGVIFFIGVMLTEIIPGAPDDLALVGLIAAITFCIIPTCILVYMSFMFPQYKRQEESMVEEYKEWRNGEKRDKEIRKAISSLIWTLTVVIYFIVSFVTFAWYITWVIFLIAVCVEAIVKLIYSMKR